MMILLIVIVMIIAILLLSSSSCMAANRIEEDDYNDNESVIQVRECYNGKKIRRLENRSIDTMYSHRKGDSFVKLENAIDDIDIANLIEISECMKTVDPSRSVDRKFDQNKKGYGGGNDVIFLTGYISLIMPSFSEHLIRIASAAAEEASWRPHVSHLGFRCIEKLQYHPGGELLYHIDAGSIYTLVLMFSDEDEYTGGEFEIVNANRKSVRHKAPRGGGILFDSNKDHGVTPILDGERHVLAVEFWPYEDTNINDKRPREIDYANQIKLPSLLEVTEQRTCS